MWLYTKWYFYTRLYRLNCNSGALDKVRAWYLLTSEASGPKKLRLSKALRLALSSLNIVNLRIRKSLWKLEDLIFKSLSFFFFIIFVSRLFWLFWNIFVFVPPTRSIKFAGAAKFSFGPELLLSQEPPFMAEILAQRLKEPPAKDAA